MRFGWRWVGTVTVAASVAGCVSPSATVSPGCHAVVLHERMEGSPRLVTVIVAIDPRLRVLDEARTTELSELLRDAIEIVATSDRDFDGTVDFTLGEGLRLVVMTTDGRLLLDAAPPPRELPLGAQPLSDPWVELWPNAENEAWTGWFVDVMGLRVRSALVAPVVEEASPVASLLALTSTVPELADPDWPAHVILVTAGDDVIDDGAAARWSAALPGSSLAVLGAFPDEVTEGPPFDRLLDPQPFDERAVTCATGKAIGVYPRSLVVLARDLARAGHEVSVSSLCRFRPGELVNGAVASFGTSWPISCLPHELALRADGAAPCAMELTTASSGRGTSCSELGLPLLREVLDARRHVREVCSVPEVPRGEIDRMPGFYYDDFSAGLVELCGHRPRLALTPALDQPGGASVEIWCEEGSIACGFDIPWLDPPDAGAR
ncbi:MAG: hypothetical protein U0353_13810 [Sandaracinus sp.]